MSLLALLLACSRGPDDTAAASPLVFESPPRNLVVITLDTTRRDHLGRFSGDPEATPTLDGLMGEAVVLEDHRSCSNWTWASVLCTQTAASPWRLYDYVDAESGAPAGYVPDDVTLMSEVLRDAGFQTALVSAHAFMSGRNGTDRGFDSSSYRQRGIAEQLLGDTWEAVAEMDPARPWYLHLHFFDPHAPYAPPREYREALEALPTLPYDVTSTADYERLLEEWDQLSTEVQRLALAHLEAAYRGELRYFDDQLQVLLEGLEAGGWLDGTLVMFWTDHGEQIYQHGAAEHGGGLYEEEIRSAAFFWAKGITPLAWTGPTNHTDLWPTALAALGVELPGASALDGCPLGGRGAETPMFSFRIQGAESDQAVELSGRKLHYRWDGTRRFFRLDADPGEVEDAYDPDDPDAQALWALLEPQVEAIHAALGGPAPVGAP